MGVREGVEFEGFWRKSVKSPSNSSITAELERVYRKSVKNPQIPLNPSELKRGLSLKKIGTKSVKSVNYVGFREGVEFKGNLSNPSIPSELERGWRLKEISQNQRR